MYIYIYFIGTSYASPVRSEIIKSGDNVKVHVELAEFRKMQAGHGGWADQMSEVRVYILLMYITSLSNSRLILYFEGVD